LNSFPEKTTGVANSPMVSAQASAFDLLKCSLCSSADLFMSHSPSFTRNSNSGTRPSAARPCRPSSTTEGCSCLASFE